MHREVAVGHIGGRRGCCREKTGSGGYQESQHDTAPITWDGLHHHLLCKPNKDQRYQVSKLQALSRFPHLHVIIWLVHPLNYVYLTSYYISCGTNGNDKTLWTYDKGIIEFRKLTVCQLQWSHSLICIRKCVCLRRYRVSSCLGHTMSICLRLGSGEGTDMNREAKTGKSAPHTDLKFTFIIPHIIQTSFISHCCEITFVLLALHAKYVAAVFIVVT